MARRRRRSPLQQALRQMYPHKILWRAMSGPEVKRAVKQTFGTRTVKVTAASRQADLARAQKKAAAAKKTAAKKTAKRTDPYAAARAIPGRNRVAAAKQAKAAQPAAAKKRVVKRNAKGQWDGSTVMPERDLIAWQRAQSGYVDPALRVRNSSTWRG